MTGDIPGYVDAADIGAEHYFKHVKAWFLEAISDLTVSMNRFSPHLTVSYE